MEIKHLLHYETNSRSYLFKTYYYTESEMETVVEHFKAWLIKNPHLPQDIQPRILEKFVAMNKFSFERAKRKLEAYYTIRTLLPKYFAENFATSEIMQKTYDNFCVIILPYKCNNTRVCLAKIMDPSSSNLDIVATGACILAVQDVLLEYDLEITDGGIMILDCQNVTIKHVSKLDFMIFKELLICIQNVVITHVKGIHIINCPSCFVPVINFIKTILKRKIVFKIVIHKTFEDLYNVVPKECLPSDLGGSLKSVKAFQVEWKAFMLENNNFFQRLQNQKVDENLIPRNVYDEEFNCGQGSFRKLEIF